LSETVGKEERKGKHDFGRGDAFLYQGEEPGGPGKFESAPKYCREETVEIPQG